ncbi:hypothetical protein AGMMS50230_15520 [Spirochaetia bacterium]|nr:hypothetical protein AGMMS50230_15520 [Spirochaetia bacterium]
MAQTLNYRVKIGGEGDERYYKHITYLGNGRVGIVHSAGYRYKLTVINIGDGSVAWEQANYEKFGGVAVPLYDEHTVYMPIKESSQKLSANDRETGKPLWARSVGNGTWAFMTPPAQTAAHVAVCNTHSDKLSIIDKKSGKVVCNAKLAHEVHDYWPQLRVWRDKLIAIAADSKNDQWTIDLYDPAAEGVFVKTILRFPEKGEDGKILLHIIEEDSLYFFTEEGWFYKLDLTSGDIKEKHQLPDLSESEYRYLYFTRYIHRYNNLLCATGSFYVSGGKSTYFAFRYDMNSGAFSSIPFEEPKTGWMQFYEGKVYRLSESGLLRFDISGDGATTEIPLDKWDKKISSNTFANSGESGEHWLVVAGKILAIREKEGELLCWDI